MNFEEIHEILEALSASDVNELIVKCGDTELIARKRLTGDLLNRLETSEPTSTHVQETEDSDSGKVQSRRTKGIDEQSQEGQIHSDIPEDVVTVRAPMLGIFYRSPSPEEPPFVEEGSAVHAGDTIGSLEVMKLFSSVTSPITGRIVNSLPFAHAWNWNLLCKT